MRRKMRRLLNEKVKTAPVDLRQLRRRLRYDVGSARTVVNQCHLTKECARGRSLEDKIAKENIGFPLQQDVHLVAFLPFLEQEIARSKLHRVTVLTKKLCRIHRPNSTVGRYKKKRDNSKLQLCDRWLRRPLEQNLRVLHVLRG